MSVIDQKMVSTAVVLLILCLVAGCGELGREDTSLAPASDLGATIGSLADFVTPASIAVEGYGLVGGLRGTGSAECPARIRAYLVRYILAQLPGEKIDPDKLISSLNTAVVRVDGVMPTVAWKDEHFDVRISALPGTQTTSLEHGWLYRAELKATGTFGVATRIVANAEGAVFIDKTGAAALDERTGYVLAGGEAADEYRMNLEVRNPNYERTSRIRNRLNERFGYDTARAASPSRIELTVPAKYRGREQRFVAMASATYLDQTPELVNRRVMAFVRQLAVSPDKDAAEIALEAMGKQSLSKLPVLLSSSDEEVRFRTARCMLNLGSERGLQTLREIAMDRGSAYRLQALEAITAGAGRNHAAAIARRLLLDEDVDVQLGAYEQLRRLDDMVLTRAIVGRRFSLEQIAQSRDKMIFAARSGQPRIVLFGVPIVSRSDIFIQSADGEIIINAPAGQQYVSLIRRHPKRPDAVVQLKSSFDLADIIRTLCAEPLGKAEEGPRGLGISYADVMALVKQMCDKGAVRAQFRAGPLPKIG